jgi:hypothetical protein
MIGRGLRGGPRAPVAGKTDLLVTDITGKNCKHKLVRVAKALDGDWHKLAVEHASKRLAELAAMGTPGDVMEELRKASEILDELTRKNRMDILAKVRLSKKKVNPFDVFDLPERETVDFWADRPPSDEQIAFLKESGIDPADYGFSHTEAKRLADEVHDRRRRGLCTFPQARLLRSWGYDPNVTMEQAGLILDRIAAKDWKWGDDDAARWAQRYYSTLDNWLVSSTADAKILRGKRGGWQGLEVGPPDDRQVVKGLERARRLWLRLHSKGVRIEDPMPPNPEAKKQKWKKRGASKPGVKSSASDFRNQMDGGAEWQKNEF